MPNNNPYVDWDFPCRKYIFALVVVEPKEAAFVGVLDNSRHLPSCQCRELSKHGIHGKHESLPTILESY